MTKARWIGSGIEQARILPEAGDIGIGAENYHHRLMVRCPLCAGLHVLPIDDEATGWKFEQGTLTLHPSVKVDGHRGVCHWTLTNGEFLIHGDSTAKPDPV